MGIVVTSLLTAVLSTVAFPADPAMVDTTELPRGRLLDQQLDPAYRQWVRRPAELLGFWMGDVRDIVARTGATGGCGYAPLLRALRMEEGHEEPRLVYDWLANDRAWVRMQFTASRPVYAVAVLASTAIAGSRGTVQLLRVEESGAEAPVSAGGQDDAMLDPWIVVTCGDGAPAGRFILEVRSESRNVDLWPGAGRAELATSVIDGRGPRTREGDALLGWVMFTDGSWLAFRQDENPHEHLPVGSYGVIEDYRDGGVSRAVCVGEHNNPFFVSYPPAFFDRFPDARMQDRNGNLITLVDNPIGGSHAPNPQTPYDDPAITRLNSEHIRTVVAALRDVPTVDSWVIGGEQVYPDCLGLPPGDFRPQSMEHFRQFVALRGWDIPTDRALAADSTPTPTRAAWLHFREQAMADRAAVYYQVFLSCDSTRLIYYPTCGHPFVGMMRAYMGHAPSTVLGAVDGYETGQIAIDDDPERMNLLTVLHYAAYGAPVITPRLGNKTLDPAARGGGATFTPPMLRRLVMECLGAGIRQIGLIEWANDLPDGEWHIRGTAAEDETRAVFAELKSAATLLDGMARLQPQAALYVSDSEWLLQGWNPQWTAFVQDALRAHWHVDVFGDARLGAELVPRVPVLISIGNAHVAGDAVDRLRAYLAAGGVVVAFGPLATHDELYQPQAGVGVVAATPGVTQLPSDALAPERVLRNRYTTAAGAGGPDVPCSPVQFEAVADAVRRNAGGAAVAPVEVGVGDGAHVEAYPLTDGESLLVALVNHEDHETTVRVRPDQRVARDPGYAGALNASTRQAYPMADGYASVTLAARGSALVWFHDDASFAQASRSIDMARAALDEWREAGLSVAVAEPVYGAAVRALGEALPAKAHALAMAVCGMLGVGVEVEPSGESGLTVSVRVRDARGLAAPDAQVTARVLPDRFEPRPLRHVGDGRYVLEIAGTDLGRFYDPARACYDVPAAVRRILVTARDAIGRAGGMMWTSASRD